MESSKRKLTEEEQTELKIQRLRDTNTAYKEAIISPFFNNRYALVRKKKGKIYTVYSLLSCKFMKINKGVFVNLSRCKGGTPEAFLVDSLVVGGEGLQPLTEEEIIEIYKEDFSNSMLSELLTTSEDVFKLYKQKDSYNNDVWVQENEKGVIEYKEVRHTKASNGWLMAHFVATVFNHRDNTTITKSLHPHIVKGCYVINDVASLSSEVREELKTLL